VASGCRSPSTTCRPYPDRVTTAIRHTPVWEPADLPVDAAGNTRPGYRCVYQLETGRPCTGTVSDPADADGDHVCMMPTLGELAQWTAQTREHYPSWRHGQTAFNVVHDVLPVCANALRAGPADPFHLDERIPEFWEAVAAWLARVGDGVTTP